MAWSPEKDFAGRELEKVYHLVVPYTRGRVLDIGAGANRVFPHWITLDSGKLWGERVADLPLDGSEPLPFVSESFDAVVSSHYIEHIADWKTAIHEWWRLVKVGGHLVLYWPNPNDYPAVGQSGANPDHKSDIGGRDMIDAIQAIVTDAPHGAVCVEDEARSHGDEYSYFQVYRKTEEPGFLMDPQRPGKAKRALVIRYGAFGDQIMASSILPGLKKQGYHVTYNCEASSAVVIQHDPNIDAFIVQDKDQVPNGMLGDYWAKLAQRYDRVINLCESVEGSLLLMPGRMQYDLDHGTRQRLFNKNYLEHTHDIAGVPHEEMAPTFYPTIEEMAKCSAIRSDFGNGPVVLWVLAGSSTHKVWPYAHHAIVRLLHETNATIILAGDARSAELEEAIEASAVNYFGSAYRIIRTSNKWPIRATMSFAVASADVVVGPETGVLNAVCDERVAKVVMLSHSSEENLTKHWKNTQALTPSNVACYPCHRMHPDWSACNRDPQTGAAACAAGISATQVVEAVKTALAKRDAPSLQIAAE